MHVGEDLLVALFTSTDNQFSHCNGRCYSSPSTLAKAIEFHPIQEDGWSCVGVRTINPINSSPSNN